jgi:hypothetical protein
VKFNSELFALALAGRRAFARYTFPGGNGGECGVRSLTSSEMDQCRLDAQAYVKERRADVFIDPEILDLAISRNVIFKAFVDPDSKNSDFPDQFFDSLDDVRGLDAPLVTQLFALYANHQYAVDPLSHLPEEEVQELVAHLGKPDAAGRLMTLDRDSLLRLLLSTAAVLRSMQPTPK